MYQNSTSTTNCRKEEKRSERKVKQRIEKIKRNQNEEFQNYEFLMIT